MIIHRQTGFEIISNLLNHRIDNKQSSICFDLHLRPGTSELVTMKSSSLLMARTCSKRGRRRVFRHTTEDESQELFVNSLKMDTIPWVLLVLVNTS